MKTKRKNGGSTIPKLDKNNRTVHRKFLNHHISLIPYTRNNENFVTKVENITM